MTWEDLRLGAMELADVVPVPRSWLWRGYIQLGTVTMVEGDPGVGKSSVIGDIAARVTRGLPMPDGARDELTGPRGVVYLAGEEDAGETLLPRILAAGGDPSQIILRSYLYRSQVRDFPTIEDTRWIEDDIREKNALIVIIDPVTEFLPQGLRSFNHAEVRDALRPLREMAARLGVAVILVRHLRKSASRRLIHAGADSIGFSAVARSVLHCDRNPSDPEERVLVPVKVSNAREGESLRYLIADCEGVGRVEWLGPADIHAWDLEDGAKAPRVRAIDRAAEFLAEMLADGPVPSLEMSQLLSDAGIAEPTAVRALRMAGGKRKKVSFGEGWEWRLDAKTINDGEDDHVSH